jgi:hypothetical protein
MFNRIEKFYYDYKNDIHKLIYLLLFIAILIIIKTTYSSTIITESTDTYNKIEDERVYLQFDMPEYKDVNMKNISTNDHDLPLYKFYIASSYKSYCVKGDTDAEYSYTILERVIESGARLINLDIFNIDQTGEDTILGVGNYSLTRNKYLDINKCFTTINKSAWIKNFKYPLILYLNLDSATYSEDFVASLNGKLNKIFGNKIYSPKSEEEDNITNILYKNVIGKVLLVCNTQTLAVNGEILYPNNIVGYIDDDFSIMRTSPMNADEYYVKEAGYKYASSGNNSTGSMSTYSLYYDEAKINNAQTNLNVYKNLTNKYTYLEDTATNYKKLNLFSIMIPETMLSKTNDVPKSDLLNPSPFLGLSYGVTCICMNYQLLDTNMATYLKVFQNYSFIPKKYT